METPQIRSALVSTDPQFRSLVRDALQRQQPAIGVAVELKVPFTEIGDEQLRDLRGADADLVFLDVETDPVLGLKFAQFLFDQAPSRRVIATGPMLPAEQMLAAIRAGLTEYLPKPVTPEALASAIEGAVRRLRWSSQGAPQQPGKLLAIFSPKGGSGSTTVATNLAIHLHRLTGKRTLLVDLDLELGEIALQLGVEPRFSFIDMVRNFHRMDAELLASYIEHHASGVHVLSAPYHPERAELVTGEQITRILQFLKRNYDYVIVDTSKSFSPATLATFSQADRICLVTVVDLPSLRNITRCLPLLRTVAGADESRLQLILNRFQPDDEITAEDVERTLGMRAYWKIANDYDAIMRSINSGVPVILNGSSRFAEDVKALGAEIAGLGADPGDRDGSGWRQTIWMPLSRIWRRTFSGNEAEVRT
jgi:pilus assembly protein CpaE